MRSVVIAFLLLATASALFTVDVKGKLEEVMKRANLHGPVEDMQGLRNLAVRVPALVADMHEMHKRQSPNVNTACLASYNALVAAFQATDCANLASAWASLNDTTISDVTFTADVTTICQSTCLQNIKAAAVSVQSTCTLSTGNEVDLDVLEIYITVYLQYIKLFCFTDPSSTVTGNYCLPVVRGTLQTLAAAEVYNNVSSSTLLSSICTPCFLKFVFGAAVFAGASGQDLTALAVATGLYCLTDKDTSGNVKYCILEFQYATTTTDSQDTMLARVCSTHCVQKVVAYLATVNYLQTGNLSAITAVEDVDIIYNIMCFRDLKGQLCLPQISNLGVFGGTGNIACNISSCTAACVAAVNADIKNTPCCVAFAFDVLAAFLKSTPQGVITLFSDLCQLSGAGTIAAVPAVCNYNQAVGTVTVTVVLEGITQTYWNANSASIEQALLQDIAQTYGVPVTSLSITGAMYNSDGSVSINVEYTPTDSSDGENTASSMNSSGQINAGNTNAATNYSGQKDITTGVSGNSQNAKYTPASSDASSVAVGFLAVALALLALLA